MTKRLRIACVSIFVAFTVSVDIFAEDAITEESMMIKASELTKLSTAVESAVLYEKDRSSGLESAELLKFATEHDPELLSRFSTYEVRVSTKEEHAALLVCTGDGRRALLEDAGCTAPLDRQAWQEAPDAPCEFKLDLAALCSVRLAMPKPAVMEMALAPMPAPASQLIEIEKAAWTVDVNKDSKQPTSELSKATVGSSLTLWTKLKGTQAALSKLALEGKLPIRHKWFRGTITGYHAAGVTKPTDEIEVPAASQEVMDKLNDEVRAMGYFTWRTWSTKGNIVRGLWRVRIVYADNTPVWCGAESSRKPCEYEIEVR